MNSQLFTTASHQFWGEQTMSRVIVSLSIAIACLLAPTMVSAQSAQEILAQFNHEPTIEETQQAALEYAGLTSERLDSMYARAGGAKALPKSLSYSFRYKNLDKDRPQKQTYYDGGTTNIKESRQYVYKETTDDMQHDIRAQWDLSGLVYNPDQLRVYSQMSSTSKTRDQLLARVTKTYFARRKLQVDTLNNPASNVTDKLKQELALQELTAQLDASTGGWYSEQLRKK